jgi:hypothetical protein
MADESRTVVEDDGVPDGYAEAIPVADRVGAGHPLQGKRVSVQWLDGTAEEEFVVRAVFGGLIQLEELGEDGRPDGQFSWLPLTSALILREVQP